MSDELVFKGALDDSKSSLELEELLPFRLAAIASAVSQTLYQIYARYDLRGSEWRVVAALGTLGELTARDVGIRTHMHKTKISRAVSNLLRRDVIRRRANPVDHRTAFLWLTPHGKQIFGECAPDIFDLARRMEVVIAAEDQETFKRCLRNLTPATAALPL